MSTGERPYKTASIILLILVLIISWSALNATRSVRQQMQSIQGELHNLRSQVTHEIGSIRGTVQTIRDDARWYTPPRFEVTGMEDTTAVIKLSWNLQEYTAGSTVTLNYRYGDQTVFNEVEAIEESSGLYAVEFPIQKPMEPNWHLSVSSTPGNSAAAGRTNREQAVSVSEKKVWGPGSSSMQLKYYIALQEGETIRTSEQHTMDLDKLSYNLFNPLDVQVSWEGEEKLEVVLNQLPNIPHPHYTIQTVRLESRRGKTEVERWPLTEVKFSYPQPAPEHSMYSVTAVPNKNYESLFVVVDYSGGITVEKEIPKF